MSLKGKKKKNQEKKMNQQNKKEKEMKKKMIKIHQVLKNIYLFYCIINNKLKERNNYNI